MLDSREPPNGDFVAYVDRIEREQLARALQPHRLPHLTDGGRLAGGSDEPGRPLSATDAQRVLHTLKRPSGTTPAARGALIGALIGAVMIAFGLAAEGGTVLALIGAVLLWHNLRKLMRASPARSGAPAAAQKVNDVFGVASTGKDRSNRT